MFPKARPPERMRSAARASTPGRAASPVRSPGGQGRPSTPGRAGSPAGRRFRRLGPASASWQTAVAQEHHDRGGARVMKGVVDRGVERQTSGGGLPGSPRLRSSFNRGAPSAAVATASSASRGPVATAAHRPQQSQHVPWRMASSPRTGTPPPQDRMSPRGQYPHSSPRAAAAAPLRVRATAAAGGVSGVAAHSPPPPPRARGTVSAAEAASGVRRRTSTSTTIKGVAGISPRERFQPASPRERFQPATRARMWSQAATPSSSSSSVPVAAARDGRDSGHQAAELGKGASDPPQRQVEPPKYAVATIADTPVPALELQASAYTLAGRRKLRDARTGQQRPGDADWANQDAYLVVPAQRDRMFLAVLDGHGEHGRHVAGSVCGIFEQMAPGLLTLPLQQLPSALAQVFAVVQAALERDELARFSGTTAVVAIIDVAAAAVTMAHVGDSRLMIIGPDAEAQFETADHKAGEGDQQAMARTLVQDAEVRALGHCGPSAGSDCPGLSVSRSLGDLEAAAHTRGARSEPTIHENVPLRPGMALVAASDGVWQKLPRTAVASLIGSADPQDTARKIVLEARARWPARGEADDITAVVVRSRAVAGHVDPLTAAARGVAAAGA